jgi:type 1 glutamine amidotransferase
MRSSCLGLLLLAILAGPAQGQVKKKFLLIGTAPDGHPPATHEYIPGMKVLAKCLEGVPGLEVTQLQAIEPWKEGPELMERADGVVLFVTEGAKWIQADPRRKQALAKVAARGGGLTCLHWAMGTREAAPINDFLGLFGGCHGGPDRKFQVVDTDVTVADPGSPITAGIQNFKIKEEFYYRLKFVKPENSIRPVLKATIDGQPETVAWSWQRPDGGRSFGFSGLHFHVNWGRVEYRRLVAQGVLWTMHLDIPKGGLPVAIRDEDLKLK